LGRALPVSGTGFFVDIYYNCRFNTYISHSYYDNASEPNVPSKPNPRLTKFELEIMDALWRLGGSAAIREIQESLPEEKRPAYTTVQTIIARLEEKGAVERTKKIGNAFIFKALVSRQSAHRRLIDELLDLFGGSAQPLMSHLVDTGKLTLSDIRDMEKRMAALPAEPETDEKTESEG
jgi:BlaI family transcriptional regulator, penicillinase repressor